MNKGSKIVGSCFITGYGVGFGIGCISGLASNIDEYPLVRLNQMLNKGQKVGEQLGYKAAMSSSLFLGSRALIGKKVDKEIIKDAVGGGIIGTFTGALYGYFLDSNKC